MKTFYKNFMVTSKNVPQGLQNIFAPGFMRDVDQFRIRGVASDSRFPLFVLSDSGLGYMLKLTFVNGKSWDEAERSKFMKRIEQCFKLNGQASIVEYTYSFSTVRRPIKDDELDSFDSGDDKPVTKERIKNLKSMVSKLEVQAVDMYFGITASPSPLLTSHKLGYIDRIKAIFDKKLRYSLESQLLEDVALEFGDKVKQILAMFARLNIKTEAPMTEKDLLLMARKAWRPNYEQPTCTTDSGILDSVLRSLKEDSFVSVGDFLTKGLRIEEFRSHWISDGCFNMLFSLEDAPDPNILFSAYEADKMLTFGKKPGVSNIPYFGTYTVAFSTMTREEGDRRFAYKNAFAQGTKSNLKGVFEDKLKNKEASDIDHMHNEFIEGGSDMVRACVMYQLSIPLQHMPRFFEANIPDNELVRSISRNVIQQLDEIGYSRWRLEDRTFYPPWINSIPGSIRSVEKVQYVPRIYLPLDGVIHLIPFFATLGPEDPNSRAWRGSNYFVSDENGIFIFDHFSKNNGAAANMSVCGATGSGKSVTVQSLVMMTEQLNPYICILDFGGGNVGSWTKLCSVMGGVELKFGSARPPRINPFQLSSEDSYPNLRKRREIAIQLGLDLEDQDTNPLIESVYIYLRGDDSPFLDNKIRHREIIERCPAFAAFSFEETMEILKLGPGKSRPGEKGSASIKIVLEILLASNVTENGPTDHVWGTFLLDDINEAILRLYNEYSPPANKPDRWPQLSDFRDSLEKMHEERIRSGGDNRWGQREVANYGLLMSRLSNYCEGGLDPFIDGQTNADIRKKEIVNGVEKEMPAKFILADMAGISDKRKLALYMIVINDFMSNILYNAKESRGIMIRDEAWLFMKSKIANPYLEADYRLARKYGFSVITIAQQYSDFKSSVLQNNTQTWIICGLESMEEIGLADVRFKFNNAERSLFEERLMGTKIERDVFTGKVIDVYSRIMIANKSGKYFVRNKISKEERWITTTDADETFVFNYIKDTSMYGKRAIDIIRWLCTDEFTSDEKLANAIKLSGRNMPRI